MSRLDSNDWSAVGSVVNGVVVIALAIINYFYLRAANRQAKAAEEQAKASLESVRLAHRGYTLDTERDLKRIVMAFYYVEEALRSLQAEAETGGIWTQPIVSNNWTEIQTFFISLYPDLSGELREFLGLLEYVRKGLEINIKPDSLGQVCLLSQSNILATHASEARKHLIQIIVKLRDRSPESSAFLS